MKVTLFIVIFLLMNAFFIISNHNLALKNPENIEKLTGYYKDWAVKITSNLYTITGNMVKLNWAPNH
ncbi:MAG: hypothetical protein WC781_01780 [Candidatus Pacearchaeota archaeon]|jgi:hypothetical protein